LAAVGLSDYDEFPDEPQVINMNNIMQFKQKMDSMAIEIGSTLIKFVFYMHYYIESLQMLILIE